MEIGLFVIGLLLGPIINYCIYGFAYFTRAISPFQSAHGDVVRRASHYVPIVGWLFRMPEREHFGRFFWLRPFLIELLTPFLLIGLNRYILAGGCVPSFGAAMPSQALLWVEFLAFALLLTFMTIATFIDFDERTIPDWVTIPGTIAGLVGAATLPGWQLWVVDNPVFPAVKGDTVPLHSMTPQAWQPEWSQGAVGNWGLIYGLLIWTIWCFALTDRRWIMRRGMRKACEFFVARLLRSAHTRPLIALWVVGVIGIVVAYNALMADRWQSLLSSLIGIGLGGVLVWSFRLVSGWAMKREALGFGDVTLMAMVGAFLGWQAVWIAFFTAPGFALLIVVVAWLITGDNSLPFGPYLCFATAHVMLNWPQVSELLWYYFVTPNQIMPILVAMIAASGAILWLIQSIKMYIYSLRK
jgi:leader peptidase (prepilin peptidase) / N-methyltransferase